MAANPVVWFELYVEDMARARRLREAMLGVALSRLEGPSDGRVAASSGPSSRSVRTAASRWCPTPRATSSACIR